MSLFSFGKWLRFATVILLVGGALAAYGQLPVARLSSVFPPGGKQGTTLEVKIAGSDLDESRQLLCSHPGVTAKQKVAEPNAFQSGPQPFEGIFVVTIAPDVPPGVYDLRAIGRFGISSPRAFAVGDRPEILEKEPNNTIEQAFALPLDATFNGHADAEATDNLKIVLKKGQRAIVDCWAQRLDSRMDATLVLYDAAGRELQRNRDHHRRDPLLDFVAPDDGEYILSVYDFLYRGGSDYFYRLTVSTGPYIDFVLPPSGMAGTKGTYQIHGRNLPGGSPTQERIGVDQVGVVQTLEQLSVEIAVPTESKAAPATTTSSLVFVRDLLGDAFDYRLATPQGVSNPAMLSVATAPVAAEQEPNDDPDKPQQITPPCEFAGRFYPQGDRDWVAFNAKKGDVYWIEVFSERLGLPTDPSIKIQRVTQNDKGETQVTDIKQVDDASKNIGGREFNTFTHDPIDRFQADQDAVYRIQVRDMYNSPQAEPNLVYRLSIRREKPDFDLIAVAQRSPRLKKDSRDVSSWTPLLQKGGTTAIKVMALRRDNFGGDIQLSVEGLPTGVTCSGATISAQQPSTTLIIAAADNAPAWAGPIKIVGTAQVGETKLVREARGGAVTWPVADYNKEAIESRITRDVVLAVSDTETASVFIDAGENKPWETSLAGKLEIPVKVTRRNDFKGDVKLSVVGIPGMQKAPELTIPAAASEGKLQLEFTNKDKNKFTPGISTFHLSAQTPVKYRRNPEAAKAAGDDLKRLEKITADAAAQAKAAAEANAKVQADEKASAEAKTQAKAAAEKTAAHAKAAEAAQTAAAAKVKALNEKANPKDITVAYYSTPVALKITPAPIVLAPFPSDIRLIPGEKSEIPVKIERLYEFSGPVEIHVTVAKDHAGVKVANVTIAKDKSEAVLVFDLTAEAKLGDLSIPIRAKLTLNGQAIEVAATLPIKVAPEFQPIVIAKLDRTDPVDFQKEILPILEKKCLSCHNSNKAKGRLILETPQSILDGGKTGPAVVAKNSVESLLLKLSGHQQKPVMPPEKNRVNATKLTPEELALVKLWIDQGAIGEVFASGGPLDWQPLPQSIYPIYSAAITSDGRFAAAGRGDQIFIYHVGSGRLIGRLIDPSLQRTQDGQTFAAAHRDIVQSVAFNPAGDLLASGGFRTVKLWRRNHNVRKGNLVPAADVIRTVSVSPDGKWASAGLANGKIQIWDLATGQISKTLSGHTATVTDLQYTPDGAKLISVSLDKSIRVWNSLDGAPLGTLETPAPIHAVTLVKNTTQIITGGADPILRVWPLPGTPKAASKAPLREISGHTKPINALAAVPGTDNQFLSGSEDGTIRQWNVDNGKQIRKMDHGGPVTAVAVRADGKRMASAGTNHLVKLWNAADGKLIAEMKGNFHKQYDVFKRDRVFALSDKSLKEKQAAATSAEGQLKKSAETVQATAAAGVVAERAFAQKLKAAKQAQASQAFAEAALNQATAALKIANDAKPPAEKQLADAQAVLTKTQADQQAAEKQFAQAEAVGKQAVDQAIQAKAAVDSDASNEASAKSKVAADQAAAETAAAAKAAADKKAAAEKALVEATNQHKTAAAAKAAADQAAVAADAQAKQATQALAQAKKNATAAVAASKAAESAKNNAVEAAAAAATKAEKNAVSLVAAKAAIGVATEIKKQDGVDLETAKKQFGESEKPFRSLAFSPDLLQLAAGGDDGMVHVWTADTGKPVEILKGHTTPIQALAYAPDMTVLSGSVDKQLIRWDPNPNWTFERAIGTVDDAAQLIHRVNAVAFSPDGALLATASGDPSRSGQLKLWNVSDGKLVREITDAHADTILALAFSPDGQRLATGSSDRFAKIFNVADGKLIRSFEGHTHHVLGVSWRADGQVLATAGADKVVKIWNVNTGAQIKTISGFRKEVTAVRHVGLGDDLLICSGDQTVRWNDRKFTGVGDFLYTCAVSLNGHTVITGGQDGVLVVWNPQDGKIRRSFAPPSPAPAK